MKTRTVFKVIIIGIALVNIFTIIYVFTFLIPRRIMIIRYLAFIIFYYLQFSLLYNAIRVKNKVIYFFPLYWGIGIWRLIFNLFFRVRFHGRAWAKIGGYLHDYITELLWAGDFFPKNLNHSILVYIV